MKIKFQIFTILFCIFFATNLLAQDSEIFEHNRNVFKTEDRWLTFGVGGTLNTELQEREINIDLAFHQRIWKLYFQTGYHRNSDEFVYNFNMQKSNSVRVMNDLYLGTGLRISRLYSNVTFFVGPSYSYGSKLYSVDSLGNDTGIIYDALGLYTNFNFTYKLAYDLGIGVTLYDSYNKDYHVYGFRIHLYFSGAFRKKF